MKKLDFSPEHIEQLNLRLSQLEELKRRFKKDLEEVIDYKNELENKLRDLVDFEINIQHELKRCSELELELGNIVLEISKLRKEKAKQLGKKQVLVNAAIGARTFFRRNGYEDNPYGYLKKDI